MNTGPHFWISYCLLNPGQVLSVRFIEVRGPTTRVSHSYLSWGDMNGRKTFKCANWDEGHFHDVTVPAGKFYSCTTDLGFSYSDDVPLYGWVQRPCDYSEADGSTGICKLLSVKIVHP